MLSVAVSFSQIHNEFSDVGYQGWNFPLAHSHWRPFLWCGLMKSLKHSPTWRLLTLTLLSCKCFISSLNLNPLTYIVDPFYLGALFRLHWFCTWPGGKLTTWVEKFKYLDIELRYNWYFLRLFNFCRILRVYRNRRNWKSQNIPIPLQWIEWWNVSEVFVHSDACPVLLLNYLYNADTQLYTL